MRPGRLGSTRRRIVKAIEDFGVTNLFGSPALLRRIGRGEARRRAHQGEASRPSGGSSRRVVRSGRRSSSEWLGRLDRPAQVYPPYGATEALPVATIGSDEILGETRGNGPTRARAFASAGRSPGSRCRIVANRRRADPDLVRRRWTPTASRRDRRAGPGRDPGILQPARVNGAGQDRRRDGEINLPPHGRRRLPRRPGTDLVLRAESAPGDPDRVGRWFTIPCRRCSTRIRRFPAPPWSA